MNLGGVSYGRNFLKSLTEFSNVTDMKYQRSFYRCQDGADGYPVVGMGAYREKTDTGNGARTFSLNHGRTWQPR